MQLASFQKISKSVGLVAILMVVLTMSLLIGRTVSNYLGAKASACPAQDPAAAQVGPNSAVISWETTEDTIGRVEYGTNPTSLSLSGAEGASGKIHNVPLTLLTPNTIYYYLVAIGNDRCDSSGQTCGTTCVPWSFTTSAITPQQELEATLPPPLPTVTTGSTVAVSPTVAASPTSALSSFCKKVEENIGASSASANWASIKQYDIDGNGVINGLDIIKCTAAGK